MRQRLNDRGVDRQQRVEQMREADTLRLGYQTEQRPISVKAPRAAEFNYLKPSLVMPVQQFVGHLTARALIGQLKRLRPVPPHVDHAHQSVRKNAA